MKYKKIQYRAVFFFTLFFLYLNITAIAEQIYNTTWGYALDLPEGFILMNSAGSERFAFQHTMVPVSLQIALYPKKQFSGIEETARHIVNQFSAEKKALRFSYLGNAAMLTFLQFKIESKEQAGWLLTLELTNQKGWMVVCTYTDASIMKKHELLMLSVLDAVFMTPQAYTEPGPVTQAVYPKTEPIRTETTFNGKTIVFNFDSIDSEANQSVIDREFSVLSLYIDTPFLQAAWQRYYRIIYRDSWSRCHTISQAIEKELTPTAKGTVSPEYIAAIVLQWLQHFTYSRDRKGADFTNLPSICTKQTGDCDSRAVLMAVILQQLDIDTILLISPRHQHALAAIDCSGEGARFVHNGKGYLIAETTAQVPLGRIAQEQADPAAWFAVDWYNPQWN